MTEQQWREGIAAGKADERRQKTLRLDAALAVCGVAQSEPKTPTPPLPEGIRGATKAFNLGFSLQEYLQKVGKPMLEPGIDPTPPTPDVGAPARPVAHVREILMGIDGRLTIMIERNEAESAFVIPITNW